LRFAVDDVVAAVAAVAGWVVKKRHQIQRKGKEQAGCQQRQSGESHSNETRPKEEEQTTTHVDLGPLRWSSYSSTVIFIVDR
jgi:hypothetical protein